MQDYKNQRIPAGTKTVYALLAAFATIGSSAIGFRLSSFMLSPFRVLFVIVVALSLIRGAHFKVSRDVSIVYKFWSILLLYGFITLIWAKDKGVWITGITYLVIGIMILYLFLKFKYIDCFFLTYKKVIAFSLLIVAIWGWYEIKTGNYHFLWNVRFLNMYSFANKRAPVFVFANTNNFALYVTFSLLLLFSMLLKGKVVERVIYLVLFGLSFPLLIISESRACMLGLILGLMVWWFASSQGKMSIKKFAIGSLVFLVSIVIVVGFWDTVYQALDKFFYLYGARADNSQSNPVRINLIKNSFQMVLNTFGFGVGSGNSVIEANHVYDTGGVFDLHNWWLLILSEYGLVFGIAHIVIYLSQVKKLIGYIRVENREEYSTILVTFLAIDVAFIICLISPSNVVAFEWLWLYWGIRLSWINHYCIN